MENTFELPIDFNGDELSFKARLVPSGYVNKFEVMIKGEPVIFEQDEDGRYRALQDYSTSVEANTVSPALLKEIALVIQSVTD